MTNFFKIASVVQLLAAEFVVAMFLGAGIALRVARPQGLSPDTWFDYLVYAAVVAILLWILSTIFLPRATKDALSTFGGPVEYRFCSTHPSYLAVDAVILFVAWFMFWVVPPGSSWAFERARAWGVLGFAVAFPALRLLGWHVFRLRPPEEVRDGAWKPVAMLFGFFFLPMVLLSAIPAYGIFVAPYRNLPVVEGDALAGGLDARADLIDKEYKNQSNSRLMPAPVTRIVKLTGMQLDDRARTCGASGPSVDDYNFATLRVDVGGVEILALAYNSYQHDLVKQAEGNQGKSVTLYGRLRPIPKPNQIPDWMEVCGLDDRDWASAAKRQGLLFVLENP